MKLSPALTAVVAATTLALSACAAPASSPNNPAGQAMSASPTASLSPAPAEATPAPSPVGPFTLTSTDLNADGTWNTSLIGSALAWCDGPGQTPQLSWTTPPTGTQTLAVVMRNETRPFIYWISYNVDPAMTDVATGEPLELGGTYGTSSIGQAYPIAPCPEVGEVHDIAVTVYALDTELTGRRVKIDQFEHASEGHILAESTIRGTVAGRPAEG